MTQVIVVCGNWIFERKKWLFVNNSRGTRSIPASDRTPFASFQRMVFEDFGVDSMKHDVKLSYMLPRKILQTIGIGTPPVIVDNLRQFQSFLNHCKEEAMKLYVEVKSKDEKEEVEDVKQFDVRRNKRKFHDQEEDTVCDLNDDENMHEPVQANREAVSNDEDDNDAVEIEDDSDDEYRFDCCDDSDGVTSDDEDFSYYGRSQAEAEHKPNMSPLKKVLPISEQENKVVRQCMQVKDGTLCVAVGDRYDSREDLVTTLQYLSVSRKFDFDVERSTPDLLIVRCWIDGCKWRLRASPVGDSLKFDVRVFDDEHTCCVTERWGRSRQASPQILGALYKHVICGGGNIDKSVIPNQVAQTLNARFGVTVDYWKAHRSLIATRELDRGSPENGYALLPEYLFSIRRANPGTLTKLQVDAENRFKCLFLAFGSSIMGFPYMRKVVVVDGTFLQGKYKGTLLIASAQDGNFQIFPVAFAVVDTENDESWEWFFTQLNRVIPDDAALSIISDRHKSIGNAISKIYPLAKRGICTYHLHKNIMVKFRGSDVFGLVKKAARAFKVSEFQSLFNEIEAINPELHRYLIKADIKKWSRAHFPGDRYNLVTTNTAESLNKVLKDHRSLPIVHLLEEIRQLLTKWFAARRNDAKKLQTKISRGVEKLLEERVDYAKHLKVQEIDQQQAQVTGKTSLHVVNLAAKKCYCRRFDLEKIPCAHAIAVAEKIKKSRISLCHPFYSKNYLRNAYGNSIMPRDTEIQVPDSVKSTVCSPPIIRQPPGRPKKARIKTALEVANEKKKKPRKPHTCSICNETGHNRSTCPKR